MIQGCVSSRLRRRALREIDLKLTDFLTLGRSFEISEKEAGSIEQRIKTENVKLEEHYEVNRIHKPQSHYRVETNKKCNNCGRSYPHQGGQKNCPARNKECHGCGKLHHFKCVCKSAHQNGGNFRRNTNGNFKPNQQASKEKSNTYQKGWHHKKKNERVHATVQQKGVIIPDSSSEEEYDECAYLVREDTSCASGTKTSLTNDYVNRLGNKQASASETSLTNDYVNHLGNKQHLQDLMVKVTINNAEVDMLIDTGTTVNIIDEASYEKIKNRVKLQDTKTRVFAYGAGEPLQVIGKFTTIVKYKSKEAEATFYATSGAMGSLMSFATATQLELIHVTRVTENEGHSVKKPTQTKKSPEPQKYDPDIQQILDKYPGFFGEIGKLKGFQVKLHIDPTVTPVAQPHRRIPFHLRERVEEELHRLEDLKIIERVQGEPTPWVSPLVIVPKKGQDARVKLCIDMRVANQAIIRERHVIPTIDELITDLNEAIVFSKIDLDRDTPHCTTGHAPATLLFQRPMSTKITALGATHPSDNSVRLANDEKKRKMKDAADRRRRCRSSRFEIGDKFTFANREPRVIHTSNRNHAVKGTMFTVKSREKVITRNAHSETLTRSSLGKKSSLPTCGNT